MRMTYFRKLKESYTPIARVAKVHEPEPTLAEAEPEDDIMWDGKHFLSDGWWGKALGLTQYEMSGK